MKQLSKDSCKRNSRDFNSVRNSFAESMKRMKSECRLKEKLQDLRPRRPSGLKNFKTPIRYKQPLLESLKARLMEIQTRFKSLRASSEQTYEIQGRCFLVWRRSADCHRTTRKQGRQNTSKPISEVE